MKVRSSLPSLSLAALAAVLLAPAFAGSLHAQAVGQVIPRKPIADITVSQGTAESVVPLKKAFALNGVPGAVVRFSTVLGNIDVAMLSNNAPLGVANFLNYVDGTYNGSGVDAYNSSFFHRSAFFYGDATVPPASIIQGGGYVIAQDGATINAVAPAAPVANEYKLPNTRGTLAAARTADPNSATSQWFFNVVDNTTALGSDTSTGYTVFGQIIGNGLSVMDAIAAVPVPPVSQTGLDPSSPFNSIPLIGYTSGAPMINQLVTISSVARIPLISSQVGSPGLLRLSVAGNTNPDLVSTTIVGNRLHLIYNTGTSGTATITVRAKGPAGKAKSSFTVTVNGPTFVKG